MAIALGAALLSTLLHTAPSAGAAPPDTSRASAHEPPRLVVMLVVDGLRRDLVENFGHLYAADGAFTRLQQEGASFPRARYEHAALVTATGHATLSTGRYARHHGVVGNAWFAGGVVNAVDDARSPVLGKAGLGKSAHALESRTLGEHLKARWPGAKVFSVALKDRASLLLAGRGADAAYWMHPDGDFVTSSAYRSRYPAWVEAFNADASHVDRYFGQTWTPLLPEASYPPKESTLYYNPRNILGLGKDFPHTLTGGTPAPGPAYYEALSGTPFGHDVTFDFARALLAHEQLGQDDTPDLLALSLNALDGASHVFGPTSRETLDMALRLDRQLRDFLAHLDATVGLERTLIVLSADHGFSPIPQLVGGGRFNTAAFTQALELELTSRYGDLGSAGRWVSSVVLPSVYLNPAALAEKSLTEAEVEDFLAPRLESFPGVARALPRSRLVWMTPEGAPDAMTRAVLYDFFPGRTGHLSIVLEPNWIEAPSFLATFHGTPYDYDTEVPLFFFGAGVRPGARMSPASPADIVPTLSRVLRLHTAPDGEDSHPLPIR